MKKILLVVSLLTVSTESIFTNSFTHASTRRFLKKMVMVSAIPAVVTLYNCNDSVHDEIERYLFHFGLKDKLCLKAKRLNSKQEAPKTSYVDLNDELCLRTQKVNSKQEESKTSQDIFESYENLQNYTELAKFFRRYHCSSEVEQEVANSEVKHVQNDVKKSGNYFVKGQIDRIVNAKRLENYLKQHENKDVRVVEKCLSKDLSVVAPEVKEHSDVASLSRQQKNSLFDSLKSFAQDVEYSDLHRGNFKIDQQGKIVIIDTETRSFLPRGMLLGVGNFFKIESYDDPDINFEKVIQEHAAFINRNKK